MREQLQIRVEQLMDEFGNGQKMLADLENRQAGLRDTLTRIAGAIQVLEEELAKYDKNDNVENLIAGDKKAL